MEPGGLTRREILKTGAAALSLSMPASVEARQPNAPQNLRTSKPVLTQADLKFIGFYKIARDAGDLWFTYPSLAIRRVGGQTRLFSIGNTPVDRVYPTNGNNPIYEVTVPGEPPSLDVNAAPFMSLHRMWGHALDGRMVTGGSGAYPGGLQWDEAFNGLWWSYGDGYVPNQHHPTIGFTQLNDTTGAFTSYGPWRTEWTSQRTRGAFTTIPSAFAAANTGGRHVAIMAGQASGNATSPFGCNLSALGLPNPLTTPADVTTNSHWTIANHGLLLHDLEHRQARDTNYRLCGWSSPGQPQQYDCRVAKYVMPGIPLWGGPVPAAGQDDTISAGEWIDLPDKHGMLYFGQLVTTPAGYRAPGDPDGFVHMWYGDPSHASNTGSTVAGYQDGKCCHGQDDPFWGATGPGSHYRVPMAWIYNPDDLIATAKGSAALWSRTPASTFQWKQTQMDDRYPSGLFGGSAFDAATRRLYVVLRRADKSTHGLYPRPAVMVFEIA